MEFHRSLNLSSIVLVSLLLSVFSAGLCAEAPPSDSDNAPDVSASAPLNSKEFRALADGVVAPADPTPDWFVAHFVDETGPGDVSSISVPATSPRSPPL